MSNQQIHMTEVKQILWYKFRESVQICQSLTLSKTQSH